MISAIGRKAQIRLYEDTLTAGVFDTLMLLPHEVFWEILTKASFGEFLPEYAGPVMEYQFWPNWDPENTQNTKLVEPDLFIRFKEFDLLIEAKKRCINAIETGQWENEIQAYMNEYKEDNKDVYLLALGNNANIENETVQIDKQKIMIIKCSWTNLLIQLMNKLDQIENCLYVSSNYSIAAILKMVIKYLEIHGYIQMSWLESLLEDLAINKISFEISHNTVINWQTEGR